MVANGRGTSSGTTTSTTNPFTLANPPGPQSYLLVTVGVGTSTNTVTGITCGTGTFVRAGFINSANRRLELWVGYNFGTGWPTSITVTRDAGTSSLACVAHTIDVLGDTTTAPSFTVSAGTTATSASADSNTLTPAVDHIFFAGLVIASTTADSTARTSTGNTYLNNVGVETTALRTEASWGEARTAVSSKLVWTLGSSVEWAALQASWAPGAPPTPTAAILLKGHPTYALDQASVY